VFLSNTAKKKAFKEGEEGMKENKTRRVGPGNLLIALTESFESNSGEGDQ
jgi:hypothetical protein